MTKAVKDDGAKGHKKGKGPKCFNCNDYGHYAKDCREPKKVVSASPLMQGDFGGRGSMVKVEVSTTSFSKLVYLDCKLMDINMSMLLDIGATHIFLSPSFCGAAAHEDQEGGKANRHKICPREGSFFKCDAKCGVQVEW